MDPDSTRLTPTRLGSDAGYAPSAHLVHYWMHDHTDVNTSRAIHKKMAESLCPLLQRVVTLSTKEGTKLLEGHNPVNDEEHEVFLLNVFW